MIRNGPVKTTVLAITRLRNYLGEASEILMPCIADCNNLRFPGQFCYKIKDGIPGFLSLLRGGLQPHIGLLWLQGFENRTVPGAVEFLVFISRTAIMMEFRAIEGHHT